MPDERVPGSPGAEPSSSYLSPKCSIADARGFPGKTLVAQQDIKRGEMVGVWSGRITASSDLPNLPRGLIARTVQVEEGLYLTSLSETEPPDYINHSCDPNVGLSGQIVLVAMRDIASGEELTYDYAMALGSTYDDFTCACGAANCRGRVTADDWRDPALWQRYAGYFSPYLQRRIDRLKAGGNENS